VVDAPPVAPGLLLGVADQHVAAAEDLDALGFGLAGATGLAMSLADRPVVAVVGDGSALYAIQALWSAARYGAPLLAIVMANGGYPVMDGLAQRRGGIGAWGAFASADTVTLAAGFGCRPGASSPTTSRCPLWTSCCPGWRSAGGRWCCRSSWGRPHDASP
jgi:benzoylformate decarboxylase